MTRFVRREGEEAWHWVADCPAYPRDGEIVEHVSLSGPPGEALCDWCVSSAERVIEGGEEEAEG